MENCASTVHLIWCTVKMQATKYAMHVIHTLAHSHKMIWKRKKRNIYVYLCVREKKTRYIEKNKKETEREKCVTITRTSLISLTDVVVLFILLIFF